MNAFTGSSRYQEFDGHDYYKTGKETKTTVEALNRSYSDYSEGTLAPTADLSDALTGAWEKFVRYPDLKIRQYGDELKERL